MGKSRMKDARVLPIPHSASPLKLIYDKVEADSRFSLYYLRAVDTALDAAIVARNSAETAEQAVKLVLIQLTDSDGFDEPIDSTGTLVSMSASAENAVKEAIAGLQEFAVSLDETMFSAQHVREVLESNREAVTALQRLHDLMVDLRWSIIEHDANFEEPNEKTFDNVEDLIADLKSR